VPIRLNKIQFHATAYPAHVPEGYQKVSGLFLVLDRGKRSGILRLITIMY